MGENLPDTNVGNIEYIRRQDAVDAVRETFKRIPTTAIRAMDTIKALPPADVAPVVHGRWHHSECDKFKCGLCGYAFTVIQGADRMRYCPNCGARMDGGDEHG